MRTRVNKKYLRQTYNIVKRQNTVSSYNPTKTTEYCGFQALGSVLKLWDIHSISLLATRLSPEGRLLEDIALSRGYQSFVELNDRGGRQEVLNAIEDAIKA